MDFELPRQKQGGQEYQDTLIVDEVLMIHQEQCRRRDEADRRRTQAQEGRFHITVVLKLDEEARDDQDKDERGQADGEGGQAGTQNTDRR